MVCVSGRCFVWLLWFSSTLVTGVFGALNLYSFGNVYRAYDDTDKDDEQLRSVLAATFFGSVLVCLFAVVSFIILLGKTIMQSAGGFFYGLLVSSTSHMFMTTLLCALVLHGFEDELKGFEDEEGVDWEEFDTRVFKTTYAFGYISAGFYLFFALMLVLFSSVFKKQPEAQEEEKAKTEEA